MELLQANATFIVPKFQRNYSWDKEKVAALWIDVMDNFRIYQQKPECMQESQYLLGPVVLVTGERQSEFFVIDGQQRLSTLTMLFCVARDIIQENTKQDERTAPVGLEKIQELIENTKMGTHIGWKLVLNDTDKEIFREIQEFEDHDLTQLERIKKLSTKTKSQRYLKNNYIFLHDQIMDALLTEFDDKVLPRDIKKDKSDEELEQIRIKNLPMLNYFLTYIREFNYVVKIMVKDNNTAFQIFETLNERGQTLSKSNLIKNHILNQVDKNNKELQHELSDKWNKIFDDVIGENQRDDEFIMESLRSRYPNDKYKISMKNLYKIIKDKIKDEKTCKRYINIELNEDASFLSTLNTPAQYADKHTKDDIYALKILGAKFIRTPILAAYRKWGMNDDYRKLVEFLVLFFFKFRIVRQEHPGIVEKVILNTTEMILSGKSLKEIFEKIKEYDNHDQFNRDFKNKFMQNIGKETSKYVLQKITLYLGTPEDDVKPIDNLTLEHILPHSLNKWNKQDFFEGQNDLEENIEDYVSRLGNLTLLHQAINSGIANNSFQEKKNEGYDKSQLKINTETVCTYEKWTASTIKERENEFAVCADKIWNLDSF